jgi:hypothetical protein
MRSRTNSPQAFRIAAVVSPVVASNTASRAWGSNVVVLSVSSMGGPVICLKSLRAICSVGVRAPQPDGGRMRAGACKSPYAGLRRLATLYGVHEILSALIRARRSPF